MIKFNVETYVIEEDELDDVIEECTTNIEILKKAKLDKLVARLEKDDKNTTIPFKSLSAREYKIITHGYSTSWSVSEFARVIPLKVASLLALCNEKMYFTSLRIRSNIDSDNPLFGSFAAVGDSKNNGEYLIARWSIMEVESLDELEKQVIPIIKRKMSNKIQEELTKADNDLKNVDSLVDTYISGGYVRYYI